MRVRITGVLRARRNNMTCNKQCKPNDCCIPEESMDRPENIVEVDRGVTLIWIGLICGIVLLSLFIMQTLRAKAYSDGVNYGYIQGALAERKICKEVFDGK